MHVDHGEGGTYLGALFGAERDPGGEIFLNTAPHFVPGPSCACSLRRLEVPVSVDQSAVSP